MTDWEDLTPRERLVTLVQDASIGDDAWGDVYLQVAIELVLALRASGEPDALAALDYLAGAPRRRMLQAIVSVPDVALFTGMLARLRDLDGDEAELLIDNLRDWSLDDAQQAALRDAAQAHRGRSKLLDAVIETI